MHRNTGTHSWLLRIRAAAIVVCLSAVTIARADSHDHFLCYSTQPSKGNPKFSPQPNVHIADLFENLVFTASEERELCNPVDKNHEGIIDEVTHGNWYKILAPKSAVRAKDKRIPATTRLGTVLVDIVQGDKLFVPAAKDLVNPPQAPDPMSHGVDHFKCYDVKLSKGVKGPKGTVVTLDDQFTPGPKLFAIDALEHLCTAADKNDEGVKDPCAALLCYAVKAASKQPKFKTVKGIYVADQFGLHRVDAVKEDDLCLPATIGDVQMPRCLATTTTTTITTTTTTSTTTTSTTTTTTIPPPCQTFQACLFCLCGDQSSGCSASGEPTCAQAQADCTASCVLGSHGAGDCATGLCTDCGTGAPCQ